MWLSRIKILLLLTFILAAPTRMLTAQVTCDKYLYDFGDVTEDSSRVVDFILHNEYSKKVSPMYFGFSMNLSTQMSAYSIKPDSTIIFRVKITASKKGAVEEKMKITFWDIDDSIELTVKANVLSFDYEKNYPLDAFPQPKEENDEDDIDWEIKFKIVDSKDKMPINNASISLSSNYLPYKNTRSDESGNAIRIVNNSYNVSVSAPGYKYYSGDINVSCDDSIRVIELDKYANYTNAIAEANEQSKEDVHSIDEIISQLEGESIETPLDNRFKANNVVFLLDISYSMIDHKRLELLKSSLINMIKILRPEDKLSVITFNTETKVFIEPTSATKENIDEIIYKIRKLKANGLTNGGEGLELAYSFIEENFDKEANNQIILSTDGGLNSYMKHDDVLAMVSSHNKDIKTSIILLKGYEWSVKYMAEICTSGKGHLLMIDNYSIAKTMLIKEIKSNSFISQE